MIHSCSYYCHKPECIKEQRDELREKLFKRQWVGLTDEQIKQDFEKWAKANHTQDLEPYGDSYHNSHTRNRWQGWVAAHRTIEAAHGIKE